MSVGEAVVALPTTADASKWTDDEKALLDAAGLIARKGNKVEPAPRSTVIAFLNHCARTGLDPIARQIYAIKRGDKWGIQVSIDGARLVAQRSREYQGQTPAQFSDGVLYQVPLRDKNDDVVLTDGGQVILVEDYKWLTAWTAETPPVLARAGVRRRGFDGILFAVARFASYAVYVDEWSGTYPNRQKTGNRVLNDMWLRMPDVMLAKVAEMLALRKAFPLELSGLYSAEEIDFDLSEDAEPVKRAGRRAPQLEPGTRSAQRDPLEPEQSGETGVEDGEVAAEVVPEPEPLVVPDGRADEDPADEAKRLAAEAFDDVAAGS